MQEMKFWMSNGAERASHFRNGCVIQAGAIAAGQFAVPESP